MEITAGLFALGGVAMTALLGELRAWRESRIKQTAELKTLRREIFTRALHDVEAVASTVALWAGTVPGTQESEAKFWAALSTAYESLNEVRLLGVDQRPAEAMMDVLRTIASRSRAASDCCPAPAAIATRCSSRSAATSTSSDCRDRRPRAAGWRGAEVGVGLPVSGQLLHPTSRPSLNSTWATEPQPDVHRCVCRIYFRYAYDYAGIDVDAGRASSRRGG
jgi:hypothetical protein